MSAAARYSVVLSYDGSRYYGWQRLRDKPTVQAAVEAALCEAFGCAVQTTCAGRTDRGVHAEGQVAGFELAEQAGEHALDAINAALPGDIRARDLQPRTDDFHPRESAIERIYQYRIGRGGGPADPDQNTRVWRLDRELDTDAMASAAALLVGKRDFSTFTSKAKFARRGSVCDLRRAEVEQHGDHIAITIAADRFVYHMVRNIVSALVRVGDGRIAAADMAGICDARSRSASPGTAPARGLYLVGVRYA